MTTEMNSIKVFTAFPGEDGFFLECGLFADSDIKEYLIVGTEVFSKKEFSVAFPTYCFNSPQTRFILVRTQKDLSAVKQIEFRENNLKDN